MPSPTETRKLIAQATDTEVNTKTVSGVRLQPVHSCLGAG
jgi:hypothetical protein